MVALPTKNVDVTEVLWDLFQKGGDLILVRNIERDGYEFPALLYACCLVCGSTLLCYVLQGIPSTCRENDICTALFV